MNYRILLVPITMALLTAGCATTSRNLPEATSQQSIMNIENRADHNSADLRAVYPHQLFPQSRA